MKYLFWDVDGTLLLTQRAGIDALKESIRIRFGKENFEFSAVVEKIIFEDLTQF